MQVPTENASGPAIVATHFSDPGCPWAYSFRPAQARLLWRFGNQIDWRLVLIGLSENADTYLERGFTPATMAAGLHPFEARFGMPFALQVKPRIAATSRACRAIVAVRENTPDRADAALRALQLMQFATGGLLDNDDDLRRALATVSGVDADAAVAAIDDPAIVEVYDADRARTRSAEHTPTHVQSRSADSDGKVRYTAPSVIFENRDGQTLEVGGFQPFEAYDTALANLDPSLERRPAPENPADALSAFPDGLTSAEVASVMRPTDLIDADIKGTVDALIAQVGEGRIANEPLGGGASWRLAEAAALAL
jgi:protein-disulfide isomerase-like protein with CxxC motif